MSGRHGTGWAVGIMQGKHHMGWVRGWGCKGGLRVAVGVLSTEAAMELVIACKL